MKKAYKKYITESTLPIYIAVLSSFLIRVKFYLDLEDLPLDEIEGGYLWNIIQPYLQNSVILSFILSFVFSVGIALLISRLNTKYSIIRKRTNLPFAISLLLLSSSTHLVMMTPYHIGIIFSILAIDKLFSSYQQNTSPRIAFDFGFYFAIGSLFAQDLLIYLPFFIVGLFFMRSFSVKAIFTSLLGAVLIYWLTLFFCLSQDSFDAFYEPFLHWTEIEWSNYNPFHNYSYINYGTLMSSVLVVILIITSNYIDNYKDKIRVRGYINFINLILILSIIAYVFIPFNPLICLVTAIVSASVVVSHFFALSDKRWQIYLFFISLTCLISYYFFILSI